MILHPALIMLGAGIIIPFVPQILRKMMLIIVPIIVLFSSYQLQYGQQESINFINNIELIYLKVDELSWVFIFILAIVSLTANIFAFNITNRIEVSAQFLYVASSMGVVLAGDWLTLLFFWELMAVSSTFLIWAKNGEESKKAGFRYFLVHFFGGNLLLAGIFMKMSQGIYLVDSLSGNMDMGSIFILLGVAINAAIYPLHAWLPDAYPKSTITGSVFMSCLTTKVAVYCLIRVFPGLPILLWGGVTMAMVGVIYAMLANDLRVILSFHIISQVGYMVAAVGLGSELALNGAAAHAFAHILYKSLLFMGAGTILYATGFSKLSDLGGLFKKIPWVVVLYFIGSLAISGFPFLNGFTSKSVIPSAASIEGYPVVELLLYLASVGTLMSTCLKVTFFAFIGQPKKEYVLKKVPANMYIAMTITASLCFIFGIFPDLLYNRLPFEINFIPYTFDHIVSTVQLLLATTLAFLFFTDVMKPKEAFLIDTDWFYRVPLVALTSKTSDAVIFMQGKIGESWKNGVVSTFKFFDNPFRKFNFFDSDREAPEKYDADHYRVSVSSAITIVLLLFVVSYIYIKIRL